MENNSLMMYFSCYLSQYYHLVVQLYYADWPAIVQCNFIPYASIYIFTFQVLVKVHEAKKIQINFDIHLIIIEM
jgi:hypothetical protein